MKRMLFFIVMAQVWCAALPGEGRALRPGDGKENPMYTVADGSGNVYRFDGEVLSYNPVKAAESSSGVYDGGEPYSRTLSPADSADLTALLEECLEKSPAESGARPMGTWLVKREADGDTAMAVLDSSFGLLKTLENKLSTTKK
ncbi:MAG: hypothetical protein E4H36_14190 [Spirochaetales bacterium]|nr:MAG: hypothetical protein E4H36_14190 [Spirochaetales bacterium]